eukprot:CAMPEP_0206027016 /NCGR_PEP_ID=MMETSP1464-20131121/42652_1 /ASSEMBLY_ACC=CAM_ASM_001124 /TAXON_ID=119497 /ORGANISM="Exanthemachrysis gayraliae, Strain RCC1523" /LENGTH=412 /DNA_ID=CAMNT_0053401057 /DNA_START=92 /DNA_END=1327 /DNA_ORIENTATION=-
MAENGASCDPQGMHFLRAAHAAAGHHDLLYPQESADIEVASILGADQGRGDGGQVDEGNHGQGGGHMHGAAAVCSAGFPYTSHAGGAPGAPGKAMGQPGHPEFNFSPILNTPTELNQDIGLNASMGMLGLGDGPGPGAMGGGPRCGLPPGSAASPLSAMFRHMAEPFTPSALAHIPGTPPPDPSPPPYRPTAYAAPGGGRGPAGQGVGPKGLSPGAGFSLFRYPSKSRTPPHQGSGPLDVSAGGPGMPRLLPDGAAGPGPAPGRQGPLRGPYDQGLPGGNGYAMFCGPTVLHGPVGGPGGSAPMQAYGPALGGPGAGFACGGAGAYGGDPLAAAAPIGAAALGRAQDYGDVVDPRAAAVHRQMMAMGPAGAAFVPGAVPGGAVPGAVGGYLTQAAVGAGGADVAASGLHGPL